jgi:hypothetical protein
MLDQGTRLDQARALEAVERDHQARRKGESIGDRVRLAFDHRTEFIGILPKPDTVADRDIEAVEQDRLDSRAEYAVPLAEQRIPLKRRIGDERAVERIGRINGLQFDQRLVRLVFEARHGTHVDADRQIAERFQKRLFLRIDAALVDLETQVAAKQHLAFLLDTFGHRLGNGIDSADGSRSERDAGKKDVEARKPAAHFAQGEGEGERQGARGRHPVHSAAASIGSPSATRPELTFSRRPHLPASDGSCVTSTKVMPRSVCLPNSRSEICSPVLLSRLPVGSSAIRIFGSGASARAMATRCCSPPDNWPG